MPATGRPCRRAYAAQPRFRIEPSTLPLDQGFWLGLEPTPDPEGGGTKAVSLYRFDGDDWSYVGSELDRGEGCSWIGGDVKRLSRFALAHDTAPPVVEWLSPAAAITAISSAGTSPGAGARPLLRVRVRDDGAGFREDDLTFLIDGRPVPSEWDPDTGDLRYTPRQPLAPGRHVLDRAGEGSRRARHPPRAHADRALSPRSRCGAVVTAPRSVLQVSHEGS